MTMLRCPVCRRSFDSDASPASPFCGEQCRWIDLGRWLDERYGVPSQPEEAPEPPDEPLESD
ncbi:MAG: DNA gyrase inhibitor YacG [Pirellulales bacterium]|nr:DNA gyrase inhibitor YacG [Pirellulales bacterium]